MPSIPPDRTDAAVFFLFLLGLCVVYGAALVTPYAYLDDYFWLDLARHSPRDLYEPQIVQGRPLNGLILETAFHIAGTISHLRAVRLLTVAGMAGMGWMFYRGLKQSGIQRNAAAMVAGMACMLPAMQVYAAWADSVGIPLSGITACAAALLTRQALDDPRRRWGLLIGAAALMLISATIYQPTAMVFWPLAAIDIFRADRVKGQWKRFGVYLLVAGVGLFFAWCVFKYGLAHIARRPSANRAGMTHEPLEKIFWFLQHPLVNSLNLFVLRSTPLLAIGMGIFLVAGLIAYFPGSLSQRLMNLLLAAILLPLSYLPNLVAEESWSSYRTQIGLSWMVLLLAYFAVAGKQRAGRGTLIFLATVTVCAALTCAMQVEFFFARPQQFELDQLRQKVSQIDPTTTRQIIFLQPGPDSRLAPFSRYDEFGRTSMNATWVPQAAVNLLLGEQIPVELKLHFIGAAADLATPGTFVIDMRDVAKNP